MSDTHETAPVHIGEPTHTWCPHCLKTTLNRSSLYTLAFAIGRYIDIWHTDPGGDYNAHCNMSSRNWRWHIHHWRFTSPALRDTRRRLITRCTWCGGKDRKRNRVNYSNGGHPRDPWWKGQIGLFHGDCISIHSAHRTCLCEHPIPEHESHSTCRTCEKLRPYGLTPARIERAKSLVEIPTGQRTKENMGSVRT